MSRENDSYFKLNVQDFLTDEKLRECSAKANGVYIWILVLMTKFETPGKILFNQKYKQNVNKRGSKKLTLTSGSRELCYGFSKQLSKHMPFDAIDIYEALQELITEEVLFFEGDYLIQKRAALLN